MRCCIAGAQQGRIQSRPPLGILRPRQSLTVRWSRSATWCASSPFEPAARFFAAALRSIGTIRKRALATAADDAPPKRARAEEEAESEDCVLDPGQCQAIEANRQQALARKQARAQDASGGTAAAGNLQGTSTSTAEAQSSEEPTVAEAPEDAEAYATWAPAGELGLAPFVPLWASAEGSWSPWERFPLILGYSFVSEWADQHPDAVALRAWHDEQEAQASKRQRTAPAEATTGMPLGDFEPAAAESPAAAPTAEPPPAMPQAAGPGAGGEVVWCDELPQDSSGPCRGASGSGGPQPLQTEAVLPVVSSLDDEEGEVEAPPGAKAQKVEHAGPAKALKRSPPRRQPRDLALR